MTLLGLWLIAVPVLDCSTFVYMYLPCGPEFTISRESLSDFEVLLNIVGSVMSVSVGTICGNEMGNHCLQ